MLWPRLNYAKLSSLTVNWSVPEKPGLLLTGSKCYMGVPSVITLSRKTLFEQNYYELIVQSNIFVGVYN